MSKEENKKIDTQNMNGLGEAMSDKELDGVAGGKQRGQDMLEIDSFVKRAYLMVEGGQEVSNN